MATTIPGSLVNKTKKHFLNMPAPAGYVAGVGRGATGFTTRSDIGPARESFDVPGNSLMDYSRPTYASHLSEAGAPAAKAPREEGADEDNQAEDLNDALYDEEFGKVISCRFNSIF